MYGPLRFFILILFVIRCQSSCPEKCRCTSFGRSLQNVKCTGIKEVPKNIPPNTAQLDLSDNTIQAIHEDSFRNLTSLLKLDLSENSLKRIPFNTFRYLTSLEIIIVTRNDIKGGFYLPDSVVQIKIQDNEISNSDLKVIIKALKRLNWMCAAYNPLGPTLPADLFAGFSKFVHLSLNLCHLQNIEDGAFQGMKSLEILDLSGNGLTHIRRETFHGLTKNLFNLFLNNNDILTIADGTFSNLTGIKILLLNKNKLSSVPNLAGIHILNTLMLASNEIDHLPRRLCENVSIFGIIDLSYNKLQSLPDYRFSACNDLRELWLNFNTVSHIGAQTFAGLSNLQRLMMIKNKLATIPSFTFTVMPLLQVLFLHNNAITKVEDKGFHGIEKLESLTLFGNPLKVLPEGIFDEMRNHTKVSLTCKTLSRLPKGKYSSLIECAPMTSFYVILTGDEIHDAGLGGFPKSGFRCDPCDFKQSLMCTNCSLCNVGSYSDQEGSCFECPAGGFYQDDIGETECKRCSVGTYVSVERHPGRSASDCLTCPYGTLSNETTEYRACRCLHGFYRLDRFGPCSACLSQGMNCVNDTAILAPNYYWKWINQSNNELYKNFVNNINCFGPDYNDKFNRFTVSLPVPVKCPYAGSCKGGIDSECHEGYEGFFCATCASGFYLRFNTCLKCPRLIVTIISAVVLIAVFVVVFLMVLWGDSKHTRNDRTAADVIMSCFKIVIGFYQVIVGIFSALVRVQWPVALVSMEKYLKLVEGNVFQFAPLSCIHPQLHLDQFVKFIIVLSVNGFVFCLILLYLFLKKRYINRKMDRPDSEKLKAVSRLRKSCYRNMFLFFLPSYPITSKTIIQILPLPGACVIRCFTDDKSQCISLLKADYSIECFTTRHKLYWPFAAVFALYPVGFPLLMLLLVYKCRKPDADEEIAFGLKVFFENYKDTFWFWEVIEMYRKLILISLIFLFDSESISQIGLTILTVSVFGVAYTFFRPIKGKFEDRLQTFVLWVIFFDVCLGAMYTTCDVNQGHKGNESLFVNVLFVVLNSSVLLVALGKGLSHVKFLWRKVSSCPMQCFLVLRQGIASFRRKVASSFQRVAFYTQRSQHFQGQPFLFQEIS